MTPPETDSAQRPSRLLHVSETVNMLYLAVCQIETTMTEANTSVDTLTQSFTHLAGHTRHVSGQIKEISKIEDLEVFKKDVTQTADEIQTNISRAIQAFQFYDRVCQRVDHVARSLEKVSRLLEDDRNLNNKESWLDIQNQIKSSYTMEAERIMFEFIMRGGSVREALEIYQHHFEQSEKRDNDNSHDEIELF